MHIFAIFMDSFCDPFFNFTLKHCGRRSFLPPPSARHLKAVAWCGARRRSVFTTSRAAVTTRCRILTTNHCSHYQINEFSLPIAVLTTRPMNFHYRSVFRLPDE